MRREDFVKTHTFKYQTLNVYLEIIKRPYIRSIIEKRITKLEYLGRDILYLDIGCHEGAGTLIFKNFLEEILQKRVAVYGIDLNLESLNKAKQRGINVISADIENEMPNIKADIVTAFEVIEHLYDTDSFLENIRDILNPEGIFIISTPNTVSWKNRIAMLLGIPPINLEVSLRKHYGLKFIKRYYKYFKPAGHIRGFTPLSLKEMLEDNGFNVIAIKGLENWKITRFFDFLPSLATNFLIIAEKRR